MHKIICFTLTCCLFITLVTCFKNEQISRRRGPTYPLVLYGNNENSHESRENDTFHYGSGRIFRTQDKRYRLRYVPKSRLQGKILNELNHKEAKTLDYVEPNTAETSFENQEDGIQRDHGSINQEPFKPNHHGEFNERPIHEEPFLQSHNGGFSGEPINAKPFTSNHGPGNEENFIPNHKEINEEQFRPEQRPILNHNFEGNFNPQNGGNNFDDNDNNFSFKREKSFHFEENQKFGPGNPQGNTNTFFTSTEQSVENGRPEKKFFSFRKEGDSEPIIERFRSNEFQKGEENFDQTPHFNNNFDGPPRKNFEPEFQNNEFKPNFRSNRPQFNNDGNGFKPDRFPQSSGGASEGNFNKQEDNFRPQIRPNNQRPDSQEHFQGHQFSNNGNEFRSDRFHQNNEEVSEGNFNKQEEDNFRPQIRPNNQRPDSQEHFQGHQFNNDANEFRSDRFHQNKGEASEGNFNKQKEENDFRPQIRPQNQRHNSDENFQGHQFNNGANEFRPDRFHQSSGVAIESNFNRQEEEGNNFRTQRRPNNQRPNSDKNFQGNFRPENNKFQRQNFGDSTQSGNFEANHHDNTRDNIERPPNNLHINDDNFHHSNKEQPGSNFGGFGNNNNEFNNQQPILENPNLEAPFININQQQQPFIENIHPQQHNNFIQSEIQNPINLIGGNIRGNLPEVLLQPVQVEEIPVEVTEFQGEIIHNPNADFLNNIQNEGVVNIVEPVEIVQTIPVQVGRVAQGPGEILNNFEVVERFPVNLRPRIQETIPTDFTSPPQSQSISLNHANRITSENVDLEDYSAIPGEPGVHYQILESIPETSFLCENQQFAGYYADTETNCQVFHVCGLNGEQAKSFLCPVGTIFDQRNFVCNWWFNVDCSRSSEFSELNQLLYLENVPTTEVPAATIEVPTTTIEAVKDA